MSYQYDFHEQLEMSQGHSSNDDIRDIILEVIPGAVNVYPAHLSNDKNGTDWWVEHISGRHLSVDCKVRTKDFSSNPKKDDLALESWSVVGKKIGWTRDTSKRTDYILWFWVDTGRFCLLPFHMLCKVYSDHWQDWRSKYQTDQQFTPNQNGGYFSECTFVPRRLVWEKIYKVYSGVPNQ